MANPSAQSRKRAAPGATSYGDISSADFTQLPAASNHYMPSMISNHLGTLGGRNENILPNANNQLIISARNRGNNGSMIPTNAPMPQQQQQQQQQQPSRNANSAKHASVQGTSGSTSWDSRGNSGETGVTPENDADDRIHDAAMKIAKAKQGRKQIPPFVQKLAQFVNDPACDDVIRWSDSGKSFLVLDEDAFSKNLIPDLFKHNNYASFVRQLNMYGFHKVVALSDGSMKTAEQRSKPVLEYTNPYFQRDQKDLLWLIQKPKSKSKKPASKKDKGKDSDDENSSDDGHRGYDEASDMNTHHHHQHHPMMIENGPSSRNRPTSGQHGSAQGAPQPQDIANILQQLEGIKQHQTLISSAIARLRKDNQGLYEQAVAFQTLHDRHENSINHILNFLATVYDKTLGGHLPAPFSSVYNAVATPNVTTPMANVGPVVGTPRSFKKQPLLLENGPGNPYQQAQTAMRGNPRVDLGNAPFPKTAYSSSNNNNNFGQNFGSDVIQELRSSPKSVNLNSPVNTVDTPVSESFGTPSVGRTTSAAPLTPNFSALSPRPRQQSLVQDMRPMLDSFQGNVSDVGDQLKELSNFQKKQDVNIDNIQHMLQSYTAAKNLNMTPSPPPPPQMSQPIDNMPISTTAAASGIPATMPIAPTPPAAFMDELGTDSLFNGLEHNYGTPDISNIDWNNIDPNPFDFTSYLDEPKITSAASSPETVDEDGRDFKKQRRS